MRGVRDYTIHIFPRIILRQIWEFISFRESSQGSHMHAGLAYFSRAASQHMHTCLATYYI
jgi:hypothetical protein